MPKASTPKRGGRPPSGPGGVSVSTYPQLTIRIPPATRHQLHGLSVLRGVPVWQLVDQAVLALIEQLPAAEQKLLRQFTARRSA